MELYDDSRFFESSEPSFDSTPSPETAKCTDEQHRQLKAIRSFVRGCLKESTDPHYILPFTRKLLWQRKLYGFLDEKEILNEAYCRATEAIKSGKILNNIPAWFRTTIFRCISEISKKEIQAKKCFIKLRSVEIFSELFGDELGMEYSLIEENVNRLLSCWKNLSEDEQLILIFWKVKGYSWKEVGAYFLKEGKISDNDRKVQACLRKQGQRILEKLRKIYKC
jgi:DNA-directed RNA polymerase specialized sigma24 family protein